VAGKRIALVTGGNRGLGFETARQLAKRGAHVVLTARDIAHGKAAVERLAAEGGEFAYCQLDTASAESIEHARRFVQDEFGRLDILVNNAGILVDTGESSMLNPDLGTIRRTWETNTLGPLQLCAAMVPLMEKNRYGRIVNVSSGMGQLSEMGSGYPAYRLSKTSLNAVTKLVALETQAKGILVNSVCPGWVKTDMGGPNAQRTPEQGVETIVWAATLPDDGPTGGFFRDKKPLAW
jgi:NAD(P)-dependent dehydrogenase (short-subunit alcohol dehydrogenase family)